MLAVPIPGFPISLGLAASGEVATLILPGYTDENEEAPVAEEGNSTNSETLISRTIASGPVEAMLHDALDAFVTRDLERAQDVLDRDDQLDELKDQVFRELLTYMMADPGTIQRALSLILISRNLERIADHATNIAEDVIFIAEARDVRHHAGQDVPS